MQEATPTITVEAIQAVLNVLEHEPEARTEFNEGLAKHISRLSIDPGPDARNAFLRFVLRWVALAMLESDPTWQSQVEAAYAAIAAGTLGEAVDTAHLRALLTH